MKRFVLKHGAFYLSRYPVPNGHLDPFSGDNFPTPKAAAEEVPAMASHFEQPELANIRVVQLSVVEHEIGPWQTIAAAEPPIRAAERGRDALSPPQF